MRFTKVLIFVAFCTILLIAGCSTTNHAPAATEVYHDITGHYNAYFNANEKLKSVYLTMDKTHKDNYKEVLPLFTYSNPKEATSVTSDLEDIEKRLTKSVQVHKVSNWADDDFLMMGKANYIKGNYDKATAFFKYTTTEYKNGVDYVKEMKKMGKVAKPTLKKKKVVKPKFEQKLDDKGNLVLNKIDQRPSYTLMIHEPARAEALVWLAKTYSAQKKYSEASAIIQFMRSDDKFYTNLDPQVELTEAENFLNQKNYNDAIKPLEKFLTMTKKKSQRVRPVFILAQLYEKKGDYSKASEYYKEVLKNRPSYEMEFYAKIRRAKLGHKSGSNDEIKKLLITMSRDGKYKDYLDQIYYELGEIVLGENNRAEARKDFHKSVQASTKNADQKALSYLQLGRMDFEEEYYVTAKFFYDSTVQNMSKTDTAYDPTSARDKTLAKLVKEINTINTEDSLQRIAKMSSADRARFLKKLIDAKQKEADAKAAEKQSSKATNTDFIKPGGGPSGGPPPSEDASSFYFYNVTSRSNGYSEFLKKWGNRKLEDNWRRKDKSATQAENTDEVDSTKAKLAANKDSAVVLGGEEEKLLAGLPMTPDKMDKSNAKLIDAYYALGTVYKDDLQSYRKATAAFEELNKRFPKNKLELESDYQLYLIYDRTKNTSKAEYYKNEILANFPNSTIAKYLKDPNYLAEVKKKENSLTTYYESAYKDYASGLYASAEQKCRDVDAQFKENKLRAKFDLLNAMALSKENRLTDYVEALNKIISKYPGTPEKDQAQSWLTAVNRSKLPQVDISKLPKDSLDAVALANAPKVTYEDTTGRAAFLEKLEKARKDQAKSDAQNKEIQAMNAAKATADSIKNAPKDTALTANAKPYKPKSRTERLDSIMKAEKAARNKPATTISTNTKDNKTASDNAANPVKDTKAVADTASKTAAKDTLTKSKTAVKDTATKKGAKPTPKTAAKDTLAKKPEAKKITPKDSVAAKKPIDAKKATKDTVATKPTAKPATPAPVANARPTFDTDTLTQVYGTSDAAPHSVIIYFLDPAAYNYAFETKLAEYNSNTFESDKLATKSTLLDKDDKFFIVKPFKNKDAAMAYLDALRDKISQIMPGVNPDQYFLGAISTLNYSTLISTKKINNYMRFYRTNYK